jgi:hypothetical protein
LRQGRATLDENGGMRFAYSALQDHGLERDLVV